VKLTRRTKVGLTVLAAVTAMYATMGSACEPSAESKADQQRAEKAANNVLCGEKGESLECKNLREKEKRNSDPNRIGYVYLYNFDGSIKGYFVVKGKVSSTQSQMGPMDLLYTHSYGNTTLEAAGDDGTYGPNENGIFFFLVNGTMVTYSGEYILSDAPLELETKKLG
jgi:hypothetical protein